MKHYIDKSALVAEIERLKTVYSDDENIHYVAKYNILVDILSFLDTIEVKEVDLYEEFENYTKNILACDVQFEPFTHLYNCAKHFMNLVCR